ncbi:MAG TPA: pitrilysin family protein [Thermoanaerobaculia bacterium]|nr:pitrilysin family protein [Thermoanaerobaculia bacterium]
MTDRTIRRPLHRGAALGLAAVLACAGAPALAQTNQAQTGQPAAKPGPAGAVETVTLPNADSPLVAVRLMFDAGSIYDPAGKEGLAALTAYMLGRAGTQKHSYSELLEALYPMSASIESEVDREVAVFSTLIHRDKLTELTALLQEVLLQPAFSESDFTRNKENLLTYLTATLRASNDELLGLEAIQTEIFKGHPYGHPSAGTVEGLRAVTLDDVKAFYKQRYTRANLLLGVAGGYPGTYVQGLQSALAALPAGEKVARRELPAPAKAEGRQFRLIQKETGSVGIHWGYPLPLNRADADFYPLMVANSFLGEHRTSHGRLMQQLRRDRGLNYGDYSYIEFWPSPPSTSNPEPGVPRRQQYFSVWVRPVVPENAHFALRASLHQVDRLRETGLTKEEFELTRDFLLNYSKLWAQTLPDRLGFHMDSRFYGMPYYIDEIDRRVKGLSVEQVNAAVKKYITTDAYTAVLVTGDAAALKRALEHGAPSPLSYNSPPKPEVAEDDKTIEKLPVKPTAIEIVPVDQVFQKK